jgi:hypothetical protein
MLQRRLFCAALLASALGGIRPTVAREVPTTKVDSWQSVIRIADFAFIPPSKDAEESSFSLWNGMTKVKDSAFTFKISFNASTALTLVVFYEGADYHEIMQDKYSCLEKSTMAASRGNIFPLSDYISDDTADDALPQGWSTATSSLGFVGRQPHWYYFFLMNCGSKSSCDSPKGWCQGPVHAEYSLLLTNGVGYLKHFSADEVGILPTAVTFGILYTLLLGFVLGCIVRPLITRRKFHATVKYYLLSLFMWWLSMWFDVADLGEEGAVGRRLKDAQLTGLVLRALSESLLLLTVILLGKGWTVVRRKISATGRVKIAIYMTLFVVTNLFTIAAWANDSSGKLFRTPTERNVEYGFFNMATRVYAFIWFSYACYTTMRLDTFKRRRCFYVALYSFYSSWIMSGPLVVLITLSMETYYRARWTYALEMIFTFMGHSYFAILFMPSRSNSMFPFAFKTAAMEAQEQWNADPSSRVGSSSTGNSGARGLSDRGKNTTPGAGAGVAGWPRPRDSELVETSYGLSNVQGGGHSGGNNGMRQRNKSRQMVSGGLQLDAPVARVKNLATSLRKKLGVVYQVADQLEEELELLDVDGAEENGADLRHEGDVGPATSGP